MARVKGWRLENGSEEKEERMGGASGGSDGDEGDEGETGGPGVLAERGEEEVWAVQRLERNWARFMRMQR